MAGHRSKLGRAGEEATAKVLERRGWKVRNLNSTRYNTPNADLLVEKNDGKLLVQVKAYKVSWGWISGGNASKAVVDGAPLFNKSAAHPKADFVIFLSPRVNADLDTNDAAHTNMWRFFVVPVSEAERLFRSHMDAVFRTPKLKGGLRQPGPVQEWVGPGKKPVHKVQWGSDLSHEWLRYEDNFDLLGRLDHPTLNPASDPVRR